MLKLGRPFSATNQTLQPEEVAATQAMSFEDLLAEFQARNNSPNGNMFSSGSSKHRGVSWHKANGKWMARICVAGSGQATLYSGPCEEEAARAYDRAAYHLHGRYDPYWVTALGVVSRCWDYRWVAILVKLCYV